MEKDAKSLWMIEMIKLNGDDSAIHELLKYFL